MSIEELMMPNLTVVWMLGIFLATVFVLNHFVFTPTLAILAERRKRTDGLAKDAKYYEEKAGEKLKEYETIMEKKRSEARARRMQILGSAQDEKRRILDAARAQAEEKLSQAKQDISQQAAKATAELQTTVNDLSTGMVDALLRKKAA